TRASGSPHQRSHVPQRARRHRCPEWSSCGDDTSQHHDITVETLRVTVRLGAMPWKSPLVVTFVLSAVLLVAVSGWLLADPQTSHADALRTGGLAAGAVVALYALWLNDRRRKVEEGRQQVERERHELELLRAERDR